MSPSISARLFYDVEVFKRGASAPSEIEVSEIGDVVDHSLLHLQCHFGLGSLSWARLGARVTGIDFSPRAIAAARGLSDELHIPAEFLCSEIDALPRILNRTFDIVFTSYGVLCWLPDLTSWASMIAHFLRPGGVFYIVEDHPFSRVFFSGRNATALELESSYFHDALPQASYGDGTYADWEAKLANRLTYEWQHSLSDVINAVIDAGLRIEFLHEHAVGVWQHFPFMEQGADGWWRLPEGLRDKIPLTFSLRAIRL